MALGLAGSLLIFTGFWHASEWLMGGRTRDTLRLIPFGVAYLVLGYLIVTFQGGQTVQWVALGLTCIGLTGAFLTRNASQVRAWVTWAFIGIDSVIIAALLVSRLG